MFELVKTATKDNLYLHGLFKKGDKNKFAILFIHGFEGDFFTSPFISIVSEALKENKYSFLSVQTRGTAGEYDINKTNGETRKLGSYYELLAEAYLDIDAWTDFLVEKGYKNIVLMGHSLGTIKAVRYIAEGSNTKHIKRLILLAPFDGIYLLDKYTNGKALEYIKEAKDRVKEGSGLEFIPSEYMDIKMTYQTYVSWNSQDHFGKMFNFADKSNNFMLLNKINLPVLTVVGNDDELFHPSNFSQPQEAMDILKLNLKDFEYKILEATGHDFFKKEHELAKCVLTFLDR